MPASKTFFVTLLLLAAVYCAFCCPPSLSKAKAIAGQSRAAETIQKEWILEQKTLDGGPVKVYLTANAVKIMIIDVGVQIIANGPDWKVHCINSSDKTEWVGNMSDFNGSCLVNPTALPIIKGSDDMRAVGIIKMSGLSCIRYEQALQPNNRLYTTKDIDVNPKCAELLDRYYYLSYLPNVPVYCCVFRDKPAVVHQKWNSGLGAAAVDLRYGMVIRLSTKSCRQKSFNAVDFAVPQHCRRLPRLIDVAYSSKHKNDITDMLDDLGFSSAGGTKGETTQKAAIPKTAK